MVPLSGWKGCGYQYHTGPMFWAAVYLHPPITLKTSKFDKKLISGYSSKDGRDVGTNTILVLRFGLLFTFIPQ